MKRRGSLFVISAPSGAGKTTLIRALFERMPGLSFSVSYTTRKPRPGEAHGKDYYFIDEQQFRRMIDDGEFVEWAQVHGGFYGTSKKFITDRVEQGINVVLDIDVQGARQIRNVFDDSVFVFILPPSMDILVERLQGRMSNTPEEIKRRAGKAAEEIREYLTYDYVIINDQLNAALIELEAVFVCAGLRADRIDPAWVGRNFKEDV